MFHLLGFYTANLALSASNVALGVPVDQVIPTQNGRYQAPEDWRAFAAYGGIDTPVSLRINTPSLRRVSLPYITPISGTALPANVPPVLLWGQNQPQIEKTEELTLEASRGAVAAADCFALLWVRTRDWMATPGPSYTVRGTATITGSAGTWQAGSITLDQTLPAGKYQVVGMEGFGTAVLAARLIFPNQVYRPGVLCQQAVGEWSLQDFRYGKQGVFGEFVSYAQPMLEIFCTAASAAQTVFLDLVKIN